MKREVKSTLSVVVALFILFGGYFQALTFFAEGYTPEDIVVGFVLLSSVTIAVIVILREVPQPSLRRTLGDRLTLIVLVFIGVLVTIASLANAGVETDLAYDKTPLHTIDWNGFPLPWFLRVSWQRYPEGQCEITETCPLVAPFGVVWFNFLFDTVFYAVTAYVLLLGYDVMRGLLRTHLRGRDAHRRVKPHRSWDQR